MAKDKTIYICSNCGYQSSNYLGKCPQCDSWGTMEEKTISKNGSSSSAHPTRSLQTIAPQPITQIKYSSSQRLDLKDTELNRV